MISNFTHDPPRILRLLGIAVSVVCLIIAVAVAALWVRSYAWMDSVSKQGPNWFTLISSDQGVVCVSRYIGTVTVRPPWSISPKQNWKRYSRTNEPLPPAIDEPPSQLFSEFRLTSSVGRHFVSVPHWFLVIISGVLAAAPWLLQSCRFSLRTLLLAMTLVAVVLGLVVARR